MGSPGGLRYRRDIDGLRAVAIALVVGFHTFPSALPAGFVGVDIFFVISGFLISGILFESIDRGTFSYQRFYERRIIRLFPALLLVLVACSVAGGLVLEPDEYRALGKHVVAGATFTSNFAFFNEAGYFDSAAELKPLLHLWSLGIEEQFYIIWPVLVVVASRRSRSLPGVMLGLLAASFATAVWWADIDRNAVFYLPVPRLWELLIGAVLAYASFNRQRQVLLAGAGEGSPRKRTALPGRVIRETCAVVGALLIAVAVVWIDPAQPFPGVSALLPTTGAALLLAAGDEAWINRRVLGSSGLVFVGLISYPLYLWHWPVLVFARIVEAGPLSPALRLAAIAVSLALAWLTYRGVETWVRSNRSRAVTGSLLASMAAVVVAGIVVLGQDGLVGGARREAAAGSGKAPASYFPCPADSSKAEAALDHCVRSSVRAPERIVFGDSHAESLFHGLAARDDHSWLLLANNSCPPVRGIRVQADHPLCTEKTEHALQVLLQQNVARTVVLVFFGNYMLDVDLAADHLRTHTGPSTVRMSSTEIGATGKRELFLYGLGRMIDALEAAGKSVVVVVDVPELPFLPADCVPRVSTSAPARCVLARSAVLHRQAALRGMLAELSSAHPRIRLYDPVNVLCDDAECHLRAGGTALYRDSHHLSNAGSAVVARDFLDWLQRSESKSDLTDAAR
jgi:peptidoglycan/LPS O-acetylase OafA/YrhL